MPSLTRIAAGAGAMALLIAAALATPSPAQGAVSGSWKVDCTYVKSAMDDPIVFPNQPGAAHMHDFFGNVGISAYSTYDSLDGVTSTCAKSDRSSYWVPSLYRNGGQIKPSSFIAYYENRLPDTTKIEAFPPGFKLVFGNKNATSAGQVDAHIVWACSDGSQLGAKEPPASCSTGVIQERFMWPYCWDGKTNADGSATGHVGFAPGGTCPASNPHGLPTLRLNIYYPVGTTTGALTLASGSVYSIHADFFNAWDQTTLQTLVDTCLNGHTSCAHFKGTSPGRAPDPTPTASASATAMAAMAAGTTTASGTAAPGGTTAAGHAAGHHTAGGAGSTGITGVATADAAASPSRVGDPVLASGQSPLTGGPALSAAVLVGAFLATGMVLLRRRRRRMSSTPADA